MESVAEEIRSCTRCCLFLSRSMTVPGEGPIPCRLMLVGEGPGRREDETGRPFVGRAGTILSGLLSGIGVSREDVFITSVVKCRPPGNRAPKSGEIRSCLPFLDRQIALVSPRLLVPMGQVATAAIFGRFEIPFPSFKDVRGRPFEVRPGGMSQSITIIPVYHPAVITHNPPARLLLEGDFSRLGGYLVGIRD